jgi:hypothetical protein
LGGEAPDVQERAAITFHVPCVIGCHIIGYPGNGKASGTMTRFAVYQGETIVRPDLFPMHAVFEVVCNLFMAVTFGNTVIGTDIFGIQTTDNHSFIIPVSKNCRAFSQPGTGYAAENRHEYYNKNREVPIHDFSSGITDYLP